MTYGFQNDSSLYSANAVFLEHLYEKYLENPESVDSSWRAYFTSFDPLQLSKAARSVPRLINSAIKHQNGQVHDVDQMLVAKAFALVHAYMDYGHTAVELDPLQQSKASVHSMLKTDAHDLTETELEQVVDFGQLLGLGEVKISEALQRARALYTSHIGLECSHLESAVEKEWLHDKMRSTIVVQELKLLQHLLEASGLESFLHVKFPGVKRFSIEGGEVAIAALEVCIESSAAVGVREVIVGMAHRGRLAALTKIFGKPYRALFSEFSGVPMFPKALKEYSGDVKYHMGSSVERQVDGHTLRLSLLPNPSHLEAVNSVVLGRVRASQDLGGDMKRRGVMSILLHGDASVAGQGSVFESLSLSKLAAYDTGGTFHLVINNQLGFTTNPQAARFGRYCTDIAKAVGAPVLHVNGSDVDAVAQAAQIASQYRAHFGKDVFLDIVCYRKYGHNEGDEPLFTQPMMYHKIAQLKNAPDLYAEQLIAKGIITPQDYEGMLKQFKDLLNAEFEHVKSYTPSDVKAHEELWSSSVSSFSRDKISHETGVARGKLAALGQRLANIPSGFHLNSKVARQFKAKLEMMTSGQGLDWAMAEGLAYATLLDEGYNIRLTGQDVERGTFSHRHAVLVGQEDESRYTPLNHLTENQSAKIEIANSNLSEFGVLAFEYGYSLASPNALVIWEAQFGDFANGAQVIIDQFIAAGESKWMQSSGLVLLLPHGYEGQGPEHSSARLERFLQLCACDNMQVVNCSTPASFFHVIRRQLHRNYRTPLIVMSPKSLLRYEMAVSSLSEMDSGTSFMPVIADQAIGQNADKVVFCSGKVYYDLLKRRSDLSCDRIALVRVEQLYPFPETAIEQELRKYNNAEVIWCQEEHHNGGAYLFIKHRVEAMMRSLDIHAKELLYAGRAESPSTAAGYTKLHAKELEEFMSKIFG